MTLGSILEPGIIFNFIFLRNIISRLSGLSKQFQISNQLSFEYPRKYWIFLCELDQAVVQTKVFENCLTVFLSILYTPFNYIQGYYIVLYITIAQIFLFLEKQSPDYISV